MKFYIVDCFAETKYQGNPLAVFFQKEPITEEEMQQIAREINFSETTFVVPNKQANLGYDVRIFTPDTEVPFAGHPTLGTAFAIWEIIEEKQTSMVILNLEVGPIRVSICDEVLTMRQNQPEFGESVDREILAEILSLDQESIREDFPVQWVSTGLPAYIIPLKNIGGLQQCQINHEKFQKFFEKHDKCNLLVFTGSEEDGIRARVFLDDTGFLEDPATGSANGNLAAYLVKHDFFGKKELKYTVSQGVEMKRPSILRVEASEADGNISISVGGKACLVAEGIWNLEKG